ncbi:MAG: hypothetical protein J1F09_00665 [Oscillospiraceae bacterium]|nr:hypothetical protein [Oscillospiraceae bacterium]
MKGKATLILTNKDTGRIVKQIEEHNMVTHALDKILQVPDIVKINMPTTDYYGKLFPLWSNLLSGIVLFGNNLEENAYKFMIPPNVTPIGSAGKEYTGANPKRGTLNLSQSGPIENGYRFVWDFAPEKAVGTIRSLGLTNYLYGNLGFSEDTGTDKAFTVNPQFMNAMNNTSIYPFINVPGTFYGKIENNNYYSFWLASGGITLYINKAPDLSALKILDSAAEMMEPVTVSQIPVTLPFTVTNVAHHFYDPNTDILYFFCNEMDSSRKYNIFHYAGVNVNTGAVIRQGSASITFEQAYNYLGFAFFNNRFYVSLNSIPASRMLVFDPSGQLIETKELPANHALDFFVADGYLMASESYSGILHKKYVDYNNIPMLYSDINRNTTCGNISLPYAVKYNVNSSKSNLGLVLRTDYLATINNLSEPLEKTDRHALQIRYEITN